MKTLSHFSHEATPDVGPTAPWARDMGLCAIYEEAEQGPCACLPEEAQWPHDLFDHAYPNSCTGPMGELCGGCVECVSMQLSHYSNGGK